MSKKNRILIFGDAMLDTYVYGNVDRVSPEAPVPVMCPSRKVNYLGGAANVARNAAALGAEITAIFVVGEDENAEIMKEQLSSYNINCSMICQNESQRTIHKMRIVGNNQQITRIDWHDGYSVSENIQKNLIENFRAVIDSQDIIIISDYSKGTCTAELCGEIIRISREHNKPVLVDPKGTNWDKYRGASVITPNLREINLFSGKKTPNDSERIAEDYASLNSGLGIDYLLLTRSECGMSLLHDGEALHIPTISQEVYDVSGAGDTVVAALAAFLRSDMSNISDAVKISNIAAGIVVAKPGTAVVTLEEVQDRIAQMDGRDKETMIFTLKDYDSLMQTLRVWRTVGDKIVTANGCFDILHCGHVKLLKEAHRRGDRLIVAINSDASAKRLKGESRPINPENDRAYVIAAMKMVDAVVIFDPHETSYELSEEEKSKLSKKAVDLASEAPMALIKAIAPDIHVKGGDYKPEDIPEAIFADEIAIIPLAEGYSTTGMIHKTNMKEGN